MGDGVKSAMKCYREGRSRASALLRVVGTGHQNSIFCLARSSEDGTGTTPMAKQEDDYDYLFKGESTCLA